MVTRPVYALVPMDHVCGQQQTRSTYETYQTKTATITGKKDIKKRKEKSRYIPRTTSLRHKSPVPTPHTYGLAGPRQRRPLPHRVPQRTRILGARREAVEVRLAEAKVRAQAPRRRPIGTVTRRQPELAQTGGRGREPRRRRLPVMIQTPLADGLLV